ncbi:hypothetical protein Btru_052560 [Bulinus truncatus]|nr:hypothetical protein Btru_052560 [Bulinus truncatus]
MKTIDDILNDIGCGKAQFIIHVIINAPLALTAWSMLQMAFAGKIPNWECLSNASSNFTQTDNVSRFKQCYLDGSACKNVQFEGTEVTIVSEWTLVCDLSWVSATVISVQMAGVLLGAIVSGHLSDQFGRKKTLFGFLFWHSVTNLVAGFSVCWQMFAVCRFFIGTGIGGILAIVFPYSIEFLPPKWRPVVALLPVWSCGVFCLAAAGYILRHWSYMHIACGITSLLILLGWIYLPESIRWLTVHNHQEEAIEVIEKIATTNGKLLPPNASFIIQGIAREKYQTKGESITYSYLDLFSSCYLARVSVVICYIWVILALTTYGINFAVSSFSGNIYFNIFIMSALDIPALAPTFWLLNRLGRRWSVSVLFGIATMSAGCCILVTYLAPVELIPTTTKWLTIICKVTINAAWAAIQTWQAELYPTVIRNLGYGASNTLARIGGMAAPFVINFDNMMLESYTIITCLTFACVVLTFTLPETLHKPLEDNIARKKPLTPESMNIVMTLTAAEDATADHQETKRNGLINGRVEKL